MGVDDTKVKLLRLNNTAHHKLKKGAVCYIDKNRDKNGMLLRAAMVIRQRQPTKRVIPTKTADDEFETRGTLPTKRHHCSELFRT
jgi:hypothetical protein